MENELLELLNKFKKFILENAFKIDGTTVLNEEETSLYEELTSVIHQIKGDKYVNEENCKKEKTEKGNLKKA